MKKVIGMLLAVLTFGVFGATNAELDKAIEKDAAELKAKQAEAVAAKKAAAEEAKVIKSGKSVMHEQRDEFYESLEEKVFRAPNGKVSKNAATDDAFKTGKKRMQVLLDEEKNITAMEKLVGIEEAKHDFLNEKYDATVAKFEDNKNEAEMLDTEYAKMKEYLARLERMESKVTGKK